MDVTADQFRTVVESVANGIVMVDTAGRIVLVNSRIEFFFGFDRKELIGEPVEILIPDRFGRGHAGHRDRYSKDPEARPMGVGRHLFGRRKDGSEFPVEIGLSPVETPEGRFVLAVVVDITERKELELKIQEISEAEKRRIGEDIHDDLCQQLAGIGCLAKVLENRLAAHSEEDAKAAAEIGSLVTEAQTRAREIARGLVIGSLRSEGIAHALEELAAGSAHVFGITCDVDCDHVRDLEDENTSVQLYRIVQEAIGNAVRHGDAKVVRIEIRRIKGRIVLSVDDDGKGMPEDGARRTGMGLINMEHRTRTINGVMEVGLSTLGGVSVVVTFADPDAETLTASVKGKGGK